MTPNGNCSPQSWEPIGISNRQRCRAQNRLVSSLGQWYNVELFAPARTSVWAHGSSRIQRESRARAVCRRTPGNVENQESKRESLNPRKSLTQLAPRLARAASSRFCTNTLAAITSPQKMFLCPHQLKFRADLPLANSVATLGIVKSPAPQLERRNPVEIEITNHSPPKKCCFFFAVQKN